MNESEWEEAQLLGAGRAGEWSHDGVGCAASKQPPAVLPCALNTIGVSTLLAHELTDDSTWSNLPLIDVHT